MLYASSLIGQKKKLEKQSIILNQSGEHRDLLPPALAERVAKEYCDFKNITERTFSGIHGKYILVTKRFDIYSSLNVCYPRSFTKRTSRVQLSQC